ncbi:GatB/YqeY domain-containing protein [Patescibacteria group bacterium]|jgi:uncharacterized protein YqeY|nr:GatB/YqeY domain-containing protein [Patescibacteria group bacterium]
MTILETIEQDFKNALRNKLVLDLSVLRMLKSAIKNQAINDRVAEIDLADNTILAVIKRELKKRNDAIVSFENGGRPELAANEKAEAEILVAYLPPQMSEQDLEKIVAQVIASGATNFGQVMKEVMQQTDGQADGQILQKIVKAKLAN